MQVTFLNAAGTVLFVRDDMEQGNWTQEEYSVNATFPYDDGKVITRGMRLAFRDPTTDELQVFEIRNVTNIEPEHYQQLVAEHIAVSELSDDHIDTTEFDNKTAAQALATVLSGSLWSVGNNTASGTSSADVGRGSKWQGVNTIANNWNVYITPRVVINSAGSITGRYLDIAPHTGVWRGVRLSIDKNINDSSVTYDDSEVITAMYGYGGMIEVENQTDYNTSVELTFSDVVWTATGGHPAKPAGQKWLEYPEKTALYGRNGRPRFGYYQNADITDANVLLQKTWEVLQTTCDPKISITGTATDLHRLGYSDQPLRLHDTVIVEIRPTGETFEKQIIKLDVDLLDPTATRPEIGDYIPNIIYINRETNSYATTGEPVGGSGGGGGGGRGQSNETKYEYDTYSGFEKNTDEYGSMIAMVVGKYNGSEYIKAGEIGLAINKTGDPGNPYETRAYINADHVNISATNTNYSLAGELERTADGKLMIKSAGGMYVQRTESGITSSFGVWDNGNLTGGIMVDHINGQQGTITRLKGDIIVVGNGESIAPTYRGKTLDGTLTQITSDFTSVNTLIAQKISTTDLYAQIADLAIVDMAQARTSGNIVCGGGLSVGGALAVNGTYGITNGGTGTFSAVSIGGNSFNNCIVSASVSNGVLTLTPLSGSAITFNGAASVDFQSEGLWISGSKVLTLTNGKTHTVNIPDGTSWSGTYIGLQSNVPKMAVSVLVGGKSISGTVDATGAYNAGWNDCRTAMLNSKSWFTCYTGTVTVIDKEPCISPYQNASHYDYTVPAAK